MVGRDLTEKSIVSFISKITVWPGIELANLIASLMSRGVSSTQKVGPHWGQHKCSGEGKTQDEFQKLVLYLLYQASKYDLTNGLT